jgi:hypothetical protein
MNLTVKKYSKIVNLAKKNNFSIFEILTNYGLFSGDSNLFKTLKIFELINLTKNIKGDVIELGIHRGNTSLLIKKILDIYKIKKKLYLLDHFKGLVHYGKKDPKDSKKFYKKYKSSRKIINNFLKFFNLKNVFFINQDATKINSNLFKKKKFCLAYFDMDLYEPTFNALKAIDGSIVKGGLIVFDEGHKKLWGEKEAIDDFLKINKKYKYIIINKNRQPDVYLKKVK